MIYLIALYIAVAAVVFFTTSVLSHYTPTRLIISLAWTLCMILAFVAYILSIFGIGPDLSEDYED